MEVESSNSWRADTVNFVLEDNIYLRLCSKQGTTIWYRAIKDDRFQHIIDNTKLNAAWDKHENIQ